MNEGAAHCLHEIDRTHKVEYISISTLFHIVLMAHELPCLFHISLLNSFKREWILSAYQHMVVVACKVDRGVKVDIEVSEFHFRVVSCG
jgi:hypothetical protein